LAISQSHPPNALLHASPQASSCGRQALNTKLLLATQQQQHCSSTSVPTVQTPFKHPEPHLLAGCLGGSNLGLLSGNDGLNLLLEGGLLNLHLDDLLNLGLSLQETHAQAAQVRTV
jgi:hypothetical protein